MTSRERITALARGGPVDRAAWFCEPDGSSAAEMFELFENVSPDLVILESGDTDKRLLADDGPCIVYRVESPILRGGKDVIEQLRKDPMHGESELDRHVEAARADVQRAMESGADGVLYDLAGADPSWATPMEYGGFVLERDRELLDEIRDARTNILFIQGGDETYLDAVCDLPAHFFMWQAVRAHPPAGVSKMRGGPIVVPADDDMDTIWTDSGRTGVLFCIRSADNADELRDRITSLGSMVTSE